jgi:hypothetical protein
MRKRIDPFFEDEGDRAQPRDSTHPSKGFDVPEASKTLFHEHQRRLYGRGGSNPLGS